MCFASKSGGSGGSITERMARKFPSEPRSGGTMGELRRRTAATSPAPDTTATSDPLGQSQLGGTPGG